MSVTITKEVKRIDKNEKEITKSLQFIDNAKFMASSWSNLVDNLLERIKWKYGHDDKKYRTCVMWN